MKDPVSDSASNCVKGHEFTAENTIHTKKGNRNCRACLRTRRTLPTTHPFANARPAALGGPVRGPTAMGSRRAGQGTVSPYVSPMGARVERRGELSDVGARLSKALAAVKGGVTLLEAVADGTLLGWRTPIQ